MSDQDTEAVPGSPTCSAFLNKTADSSDYSSLASTLVNSYGASSEPGSARAALEWFLANHPGLSEEDKNKMREKEGYVADAVQEVTQ